MDITSLLGTALGLGALVLGQWLGGGHFGQIFQFTAIVIVFGGTAGATLVSFTVKDLSKAISLVPAVYRVVASDLTPVLAEIVRVAGVARKDGALAVEAQRASIRSPLLKRALRYIVEGQDAGSVRDILEAEIRLELEEREIAARVFESAGGYAPVLGIVGAVLGLIQVMTLLDQPSKVGGGIALAFVAILYGLALSNLLLLPWASKLRRKSALEIREKELVKQGVVAILEGQTPNSIQERLEIFLQQKAEPS